MTTSGDKHRKKGKILLKCSLLCESR